MGQAEQLRGGEEGNGDKSINCKPFLGGAHVSLVAHYLVDGFKHRAYFTFFRFSVSHFTSAPPTPRYTGFLPAVLGGNDPRTSSSVRARLWAGTRPLGFPGEPRVSRPGPFPERVAWDGARLSPEGSRSWTGGGDPKAVCAAVPCGRADTFVCAASERSHPDRVTVGQREDGRGVRRRFIRSCAARSALCSRGRLCSVR